MLDVDGLIRYIRILSELSAQIRYSSQKRVLVEITLIKLCRPQMDAEQDISTLKSRIAALERQMEEGMVSVKADSSAVVENESVQRSAEKPEEKPKVLPRALPEELKDILQRWNEVSRQYGQPGETYLNLAKKVLSEQGTLVLQFVDKHDEDFFQQNDGAELKNLRQVIETLTGREVVLETRTVNEAVDAEYGDIASLIHFDGIEFE